MQPEGKDPKYLRIIADPNHWFETRLEIGEAGHLIEETEKKAIAFGTGINKTLILISSPGPNAGYDEGVLYDMAITRKIFANGVPQVGCCVSGEIDVRMRRPTAEIPRMARLVPWIRAVTATEASNWIQKGEFYTDTREFTNNSDKNVIVTLHGYDGMLKAEQPFPSTRDFPWPARDWQVVELIANTMGVRVDDRTWGHITSHGDESAGYEIQLPASYTCREVLGFIAGMYAGNWVMNDWGELRLVALNELPYDTRVLTDHVGNPIVFGTGTEGVRVNV